MHGILINPCIFGYWELFPPQQFSNSQNKKSPGFPGVALLYQVVSAISFSIPPIILNALEFSINSFHS